MDTAKAVSRLRSLASDSTRRSKTAVLRDVFREIEGAIAAGVSQVTILDELRSLGLAMSQDAFRSALRRLRAEHPLTDRDRGERATDFAMAPFGARTSFAATTSSGSLYDVEALSRLLRASRPVDVSPPAQGA
jgi:hypothetical protein